VELDCSFDGSGSSDPDGDLTSWSWTFGDGASGTGESVTHEYGSPGSRTVTLTVTDAGGRTDSTTRTATTSAAGIVVSFVAADSTNGNRINHTVDVPSTVQAGDVLLLFFSGNRDTATITPPAGWTEAARSPLDGVVSRLWWKVAAPGDAGDAVLVRTSVYTKADLTVAAYRGAATDSLGPVAVAVDSTSGPAYRTPAVTVQESGGWLISYWSSKSSSTTGWSLPAGQLERSASTGTGGGNMTAVLADKGSPTAPGQAGGLMATADGASSAVITYSVVVRLAG
jgi:PKD repeat protein